MNNLPKEVRLGYRKYRFEDLRKFHESRDDCAFGLTDKTTGVVQIYCPKSKKYPDLEDLNTVIHELLHCAHDAYGTALETDEEEKQVNQHANMITELLCRNPEVVKFINDCLKKVR